MNTAFVPADHAARAKRRILVAASLVTALSMFDSNIVAVSLPSIARTLGADFAEIEWVISAYMLTFSALLLAAGSYADRHGRKRATLIGLAVFAVASGLCGLAQSALMLNLARALQGVGASLLVPAGLAIINHAFAAHERAKAYAFWGACLGIALTSGPIVGGVVTNLFGWRWVFLINLPICIALFVAIVAFVEESRDHEARHLDYAGILTFSAGLFLLIWALIDGNALGWTARPIVERLVGAAALLVAFLFVELVQKRPMVDFTLFAQPTFLGSVFAMLGYAGGAQVMIFYLPLFLQNAFDLSPAMAGLAMLPFALPMFLTPLLAAGLARRYSGRTLLTVGLMTTVIGNLLLWALARSSLPYPAFLLGMLVAGAGAGLLNSETTKVMQGAVPAQRAGMASGLTATTRYIGVLVGVAALGAVLTQIASRRFITGGVEAGLDAETAAELAKHVTSGDVAGIVGTVPEALRASVWQIGNAAFADGFAAAALLAAAVAAAAALFTVLLVRRAETLPVTGGSTHPGEHGVKRKRGGSHRNLPSSFRPRRKCILGSS
ncbi:MAG TPA: MFS transporter [Bradyrhizobium sp.]|nr:MFS transporter [Bradyrhizobium sp.]